LTKGNRIVIRQLESNNEFGLSVLDQYHQTSASLNQLYLPTDIPNKGNDFYSQFAPFVHTETGKVSDELADHQLEIWNDRWKYIYREYVKAQKIGVSTLCLLEDIHHALTDCMGKEIMIIAQSLSHAIRHLQDFRKMVISSPEYHDYLIIKPIPGVLLRDEVTKITEAYMHNPNNPFRPTHIYALGMEPGSLVSFKTIGHIHASDITKSKYTPEIQKESFGAFMSRLGISAGSCVMEAPPRGLSGPLFEQFEQFEEIKKAGIELEKLSRHEQMKYPFYVKKYTYQVGLDAGLLTPEFIEGEKLRLGPLFKMYYEADFYESDQSWYKPQDFKTSDEASDFFSGVGLQF
jgi:hypothetical protein